MKRSRKAMYRTSPQPSTLSTKIGSIGSSSLDSTNHIPAQSTRQGFFGISSRARVSEPAVKDVSVHIDNQQCCLLTVR